LTRGKVLDLLENETGMHSCLALDPRLASPENTRKYGTWLPDSTGEILGGKTA